jgi:hypothetical protein
MPDMRDILKTLQDHQKSSQATMQELQQEIQRSNRVDREQHQAMMAQQYEVWGERFNRMGEAIAAAARRGAVVEPVPREWADPDRFCTSFTRFWNIVSR